MHDRDMYRHAVEEYDKKPVGLGGQDSQVVFVSEMFCCMLFSSVLVEVCLSTSCTERWLWKRSA